MKPIVIIESPWRNLPEASVYLDSCILDAISRGEAPFASHRMYTSALDDLNPGQRHVGMLLTLPFIDVASHVAVYLDHGISSGMQWGIQKATDRRLPILYRWLYPNTAESKKPSRED